MRKIRNWLKRVGLVKFIKQDEVSGDVINNNVSVLGDSMQKMSYGNNLNKIVKPDASIISLSKKTNKFGRHTINKKDYSVSSGLEVVFFRLEDVMSSQRPFLDRTFSLEKLSKKAGTNRTYASNAINSIAKCSFNQYVNTYRLNYATDISENSIEQLSIDNLSVMSGYRDVRSFLIALYNTEKNDYTFLKNQYLYCDKKQKYFF